MKSGPSDYRPRHHIWYAAAPRGVVGDGGQLHQELQILAEDRMRAPDRSQGRGA